MKTFVRYSKIGSTDLPDKFKQGLFGNPVVTVKHVDELLRNYDPEQQYSLPELNEQHRAFGVALSERNAWIEFSLAYGWFELNRNGLMVDTTQQSDLELLASVVTSYGVIDWQLDPTEYEHRGMYVDIYTSGPVQFRFISNGGHSAFHTPQRNPNKVHCSVKIDSSFKK